MRARLAAVAVLLLTACGPVDEDFDAGVRPKPRDAGAADAGPHGESWQEVFARCSRFCAGTGAAGIFHCPATRVCTCGLLPDGGVPTCP